VKGRWWSGFVRQWTPAAITFPSYLSSMILSWSDGPVEQGPNRDPRAVPDPD
jgi:hypothetical protein